MQTLSESEFERLQNGDQTVFRKIYDGYFGLVMYVVERCGAVENEREEITQEAFVRLYRDLKRIQGPDKLKSWLCTTAKNLVIDRARRRQKQTEADLNQIKDENVLHDQLLREAEIVIVGELVDAIGKEKHGADFVAFYREGVPVKEIARRNGEAVSTITTRLSRLRRQYGQLIREQIEKMRHASPF